jgi:preprotein translocase subunit SecG
MNFWRSSPPLPETELNMLHSLIMGVHYICALSIVGLVLIQRGKGAEAGAGFGAGASGTVFGARGAGTALSRATAVLAAVFMLTSLTLAYVGTKKTAEPTSVLDSLPAATSSAPLPAAGSVPNLAPGASSAPEGKPTDPAPAK